MVAGHPCQLTVAALRQPDGEADIVGDAVGHGGNVSDASLLGVSASHEASMLRNTVFDGIEACGVVTG
jgi:hypothetical protein